MKLHPSICDFLYYTFMNKIYHKEVEPTGVNINPYECKLQIFTRCNFGRQLRVDLYYMKSAFCNVDASATKEKVEPCHLEVELIFPAPPRRQLRGATEVGWATTDDHRNTCRLGVASSLSNCTSWVPIHSPGVAFALSGEGKWKERIARYKRCTRRQQEE